MREGIHFYFGKNQGLDNGFRSVDYGIMNCNISGGMIEEPYISTREIRETYIRGNPKPYFHGVDMRPIQLRLTFAFENFHTGFTPNDKNRALRELAYWLTRDFYVPFGIIGQDTMFYVMCVDESILSHNAMSQGYVEITLRNDAPWSYSEIKTLSYRFDPTADTRIRFINNGDLPVKPEIWFNMPFIDGDGVGDFTITKHTNDTSIFKFNDLLSQEEIYVNNEKEYIESVNTQNYRYDNFNNKYLSLNRGNTELTIKGAESMIIKYQEKRYTI